MRELVKVLKALTDQVRIRILKILEDVNDLCVCEVMQVLDISQTRASRNLGILKDAGFVVDRREGMRIFYSINKEKFNEYHFDLMNLLSGWLNDDDTVRKDRARLKQVIKSNFRQKCKK